MSELTRGRSGRWLLIAMALGLIVALAIIAPQANADHTDPVMTGDDAGIILLSTGPAAGDNWIRYYDQATVDGSAGDLSLETPTQEQTLFASRCQVSSNDSIFDIDQTGGRTIGLVSNGLGVREKNNCSTDGGQVDPDQSLTFQLTLEVDEKTDFWITGAEIDVEGKFNAKLGVSLDGGPVTPHVLKDSNDNGPDAGGADNNIAEITDYFRQITFTAIDSSKAKVAIEGGGDGDIDGSPLRDDQGVSQSLFVVYQGDIFDHGDLDCSDTSDGTATPDDEGPATTIHLTRGDNLSYEGKADQDCVPVPFSFRIEDDSVFFDADLTGQENARFLIRIDWDPADPVVDPFNPPDRRVNFEPEGRPGGYNQVDECVELTSEGTIDNLDPDADDVYEHPIGAVGTPYEGQIVPWCLAGERLVLLGDGTWQQIQWYDGAGDPRFQ